MTAHIPSTTVLQHSKLKGGCPAVMLCYTAMSAGKIHIGHSNGSKTCASYRWMKIEDYKEQGAATSGEFSKGI